MTKLLVTGGIGLIGSAIQQLCPDATFISRQEFNLLSPMGVFNMFERYTPDAVIHLAGKVGGVATNTQYPVDFFEENVLINTLVLQTAHKFNVKRVLSCMSTCVFPDNVEYPLQPNKIHLGEPHSSNFGYAYAKRMLEVQTRAYQTQYNKQWFTVIPTNVYGPHDNYNLKTSHVIPALIHKCYLAKQNDTPLHIWGSGRAIREFIYSKDLAELMLRLIDNYDSNDPIILSSPNQYSVSEVVEMIASLMNFKGEIIYDNVGPEGQYRKPSDITPLQTLYPDFKYTPFSDGMKNSIDWFCNNYNSARI